MTSIEASVLDRFRHVRNLQWLDAGEVGDGAGNLEHPMIGTRGEPQPGNRGPQGK